MKHQIAASIIVSLFLTACTSADSERNSAEGEPIRLEYAHQYSMCRYEGYTRVTISDPWHEGNQLGTFYLIYNDSIATPGDGTRINVPVKSIATNTCSHIAFIAALKRTDAVTGVCNPSLIFNRRVRERVADNKCSDLGDSFAMDFERTLMTAPGLLTVTEYGQADGNISRISTSGIPVMGLVEWTEPDILGRAEWIKLFGALLGREKEADSIFNMTVNHYKELESMTENVEYRPSILPGIPFKGTWYMPGGNSYMATLFRHAGGSYKYESDSTAGSLPLSLETVLAGFTECDYWLGADAASKDEIGMSDDRLEGFAPMKSDKVYNNRKRTTPEGGNDFWESAVVRPDLLLQDLIVILHPDLLPGVRTIYMEHIE